LTNSTSKRANKLHGYEEITRPHLSIQAKFQLRPNVISLGLVLKLARVRR
jgi:hypothetical protein